MVPRKCSELAWEYRTGGTTGEFLKIYVPVDIQKTHSLAAAFRAWRWAGFHPGDRYVRLWGLPLDVSRRQRLLTKVVAALEREHRFNAFLLSEDQCLNYVARIRRIRPKVILSHATPLVTLAKYMNDMELSAGHITAILTSAEMLLPTERELIEDAFNTKVYDYYGNRETNLIAAQCQERGGYHVSAENGVIEVVDGDGHKVGEGQTGEVVITDFHNYVMPLIRYRIGDLAEATYRKCPCGLELPLIKNFVGRKLEIIRTPSGHAVPGEFFLLLLDRYRWIEKAQVLQESVNRIVLNVAVKDVPQDIEEERRRIKQDIRDYLGDTEVSIVQKDSRQFLSSGKHRWVISRI